MNPKTTTKATPKETLKETLKETMTKRTSMVSSTKTTNKKAEVVTKADIRKEEAEEEVTRIPSGTTRNTEFANGLELGEAAFVMV